MTIAYTVDRGSAESDRDAIFELTRSIPEYPVSRFEKYFRDNLLEDPVIIIARESSSAEPVGMAVLLPTDLVVSGETLRGGITGDFVTAPEHRGLGPSFKIQQAVVEAARSAGYSFIYGTPNPAAYPLIKRMGFRDLGPMSIYVKVLRAAHPVEKLTGSARLGQAAGIVDPLLGALARRHRYRPQEGLKLIPLERADHRFASVLAGRKFDGVRGARSVELLNWKFELGPTHSGRFRLTAVGTEEKVAGYAVSTIREGGIHVVDLGFEDARALKVVLTAMITESRQKRAPVITVRHFGEDPELTAGLRSVGFIRRVDSLRLMFRVEDDAPFASTLLNPGRWRFFAGDADL